MHRISRRFLVVLVVVGALAAGGAAYTNSITGAGTTSNTAGYADVSVSGATLADASYTFSSDGTQITAVTFTFTGDIEGERLQFGLGTAANPTLANCANTGISGGVIPSGDYDGTTNTVVTCNGLSVTTGTATDLGVLVSNT